VVAKATPYFFVQFRTKELSACSAVNRRMAPGATRLRYNSNMRKIGWVLIWLPMAGVGVPTAAQEAKTPPTCVIADQALAQGQPELALTQYQKCLSQAPPSFEIISNAGMACARMNRFDEAIKYYTQALSLDPGNPPIRFNLGLAYLKKNQPESAAKEFARSLMGDPSNMRALELMAVCHFQMKEFELAAFETEQVLKSEPNEGSALFVLGSSLLRLGIYKEAIQLIYSSIQSNNTAEAHVVLGQAFLGVNTYAQALKEFQEAEKLQPDLEGIHSQLGTAYAGLGSTDKAIVEFQKELQKHPDNFDANYSLGRLKRLSNNMDEALQYLSKAQKLRPDSPAVGYEYAVLAMQDKDYAKAESILTGILQKLPDYLDAHVLLAQVYFHLHQTEEGNREKALVDAIKNAQQARTDAEGKALNDAALKKPKPASTPR
jgi:tetratricopeptide (TPR) repeat protein